MLSPLDSLLTSTARPRVLFLTNLLEIMIETIIDHYHELGQPELLDDFVWTEENIQAEYNIIMDM